MLEDSLFDFIPCGDPPTVDNTWRHFWKGIICLAVFIIATYVFADPKMYVKLLLLFSVLVLFLTSVALSNQFTIKIHIDKTDNKLYKYYITAFGKEKVTVLDLNSSKIIYKFDISRSRGGWMLKVKDKKSFIEIRETRNPFLKTQKNVFTKAQLDEMNAILISRV